jgi:phage-related protein
MKSRPTMQSFDVLSSLSSRKRLHTFPTVNIHSPIVSASLHFFSNIPTPDRSILFTVHQRKAYDSSFVDVTSVDMFSQRIESRHASPSCAASLSGKRSLGEVSNADRWFEQYNTGIQENNMACMNDDSPFFIDNGPSIQTAAAIQRRGAGTNTRSSIDPKTSLSQLDTDYVSAETFRDIVDDLTVQIGSLERQLRRDDKSNSLMSESRKPFEVKVHSLKADEKQELERILHRFVNGLPKRDNFEDLASRYEDLLPSGKPYSAMSSRISILDTRSPLASDSASVSRLSPSTSDNKQREIPEYGRSNQVLVQPDLKYTGNCVLSRDRFEVMAMHTKKRLVVDRLEQLFAGENGFSEPKLQAPQRPETLHEVTRMEHSIIRAWNQQTISETVCAVHMLNKKTETLVTATTTENLEATQQAQTSRLFGPELGEKSTKALPRLELKPSQLVAENVRYIRQVGLSPVDSGTSMLPGDEYEWFYLNVLANMAELHILNVTRDFIRKAVSELSSHYIISTDGQKVRWNSRWNLLRKRTHDDHLSGSMVDETSVPRVKRLKTVHATSSRTSLQKVSRSNHAPSASPSPWISHQSNGKLVYAPRFHFSAKNITDSISSFNTRSGDRALTEPSDHAEISSTESIAHGYPLPSDQ